jgi:hypothetical protein
MLALHTALHAHYLQLQTCYHSGSFQCFTTQLCCIPEAEAEAQAQAEAKAGALPPLLLPRREVHLAITHPTWSRHQHHRFPPAFRAAARTLLLATQRASNASAASDNSSTVRGECGGSVVCEELGRLPEGVLGHVLQLAAYPLSVWAGADASHNP